MNQVRKHFIDRNEGFVCLHCGFENGPSKKSCRNHCRQCLFSKHVDEEIPGDRDSHCGALMKPIALEQHSQKGQMIVHECIRCGKRMRNTVAADDDLDAVIELGLLPLKG